MAPQPDIPSARWILGLDLGANSLGWAALRMGQDGEPEGVLHPPEEMPEHPSLGVRIFDAGVENYGQGDREQSRAVQRRIARLQRRQTMRRARRMSKSFGILQRAGLLHDLEEGSIQRLGSREAARDDFLKKLDRRLAEDLAARVRPEERARLVELLPYALRSYAMELPLTAGELGRALFHLAQRRGFQSNRKVDAKDDERSKVKEAIRQLAESLAAASGASTLGSYLYKAGLRGEKLRRRWTSRKMYRDEFEAIWNAQHPHHPALLTDDLRKELWNALFFQRPLRDQSDLVGTCEIENGREYVDRQGVIQATRRRKRAPECLLVSQRFRIRQSINNIRVQDEAGDVRDLTADERERIAKELETTDSMGKQKLKKILGIPPRSKVNLEAELKGNRTNAQLLAIFGDRWTCLSADRQEAVVWEIWNAPDNQTLVERAREGKAIWKLLRPTRDEAGALDDLVIGGDYASLSRRAMLRLLPALENGVPYSRAWREVYGSPVLKEAREELPPVDQIFEGLRNPSVMRALTELRRVVNTLVREYGRPEKIRIELARDLKRGKEDRKRLQDDNKRNEGIRQRARKRLFEELGKANPTEEDVLRVRLWEECSGVCPYTGKSIGMSELFGGQVDIEHIIPFSRCLDDSFTNLTICVAEINRNQKRNHTPFETFGHDVERWEAMVARMRKHVDEKRMSPGKLHRFTMRPEEQEEFLKGFSSSQLNDTRYASVWAREYLTSLYGGDLGRGVDPDGVTRVQVGNGSVTALLRRVHGIGRLLPTSRGEKRTDHRHHAVDAVFIGLTSPAIVKRLSSAAEHTWDEKRRRIQGLPDPWPEFVEDIKSSIERVVASIRIQNRVRGPLHAKTIYSPRRDERGSRNTTGPFTHVRKRVESLSRRDCECIVDERVRKVIVEFLAGRDADQVCVAGDPSSYPFLTSKDGRRIPILRVRIRKANTTREVGRGARSRHVETEANHHLVLREEVDPRGRKMFRFDLVPMAEAYRRRKDGEPIIRRCDGLCFTVRRNDVLEVCEKGREPRLCRVLSLTDSEVEGCWVNDARTSDERRDAGARVRISPKKLSERVDCRKVSVSPIGVVRPCRA